MVFRGVRSETGTHSVFYAKVVKGSLRWQFATCTIRMRKNEKLWQPHNATSIKICSSYPPPPFPPTAREKSKRTKALNDAWEQNCWHPVVQLWYVHNASGDRNQSKWNYDIPAVPAILQAKLKTALVWSTVNPVSSLFWMSNCCIFLPFPRRSLEALSQHH